MENVMFKVEHEQVGRNEYNMEKTTRVIVVAKERPLLGLAEARQAKVELEDALTALVASYRRCVSAHVVEVTGEEIDNRVTVTVAL